MTLSERIEAIRAYSGLDISKFARHVGFKTPQAVRELLKGNTKSLSDMAFYKITTAFPNISEDWLLSGEGKMLKPTSQRSVGSVSGNGVATLGNDSPVLKDVTIDVAQDLASDVDDKKDIAGYKSEVKRLRTLLAKAECEISRLSGRVEEQERFINKLLERE